METPRERSEDRLTLGSAILRSLVRRFSGSSPGSARGVIGGGASGIRAGQGPRPGVGAGSTTVSASGAPSGRGTNSRRESRDLSPSKAPGSTPGHDGPGGGGGGGGGPTAAGGSQDWRRLVGSIRRKVNRKTAQGSSSISEAALQDTNRNHDDFLKATMRIFLVVSPPMGRVQVTLVYPTFCKIISMWFGVSFTGFMTKFTGFRMSKSV